MPYVYSAVQNNTPTRLPQADFLSNYFHGSLAGLGLFFSSGGVMQHKKYNKLSKAFLCGDFHKFIRFTSEKWHLPSTVHLYGTLQGLPLYQANPQAANSVVIKEASFTVTSGRVLCAFGCTL